MSCYTQGLNFYLLLVKHGVSQLHSVQHCDNFCNTIVTFDFYILEYVIHFVCVMWGTTKQSSHSSSI